MCFVATYFKCDFYKMAFLFDILYILCFSQFKEVSRYTQISCHIFNRLGLKRWAELRGQRGQKTFYSRIQNLLKETRFLKFVPPINNV